MQLNIRDILKILPHSYPFLLVDRVINCVLGHNITALKNVTFNEPFFQGHFPSHPIMPGVLIIEAMAQVSAICVMSEFNLPGQSVYFMSLDKAKFRRPVTPGDSLIIKSEVLSSFFLQKKLRISRL